MKGAKVRRWFAHDDKVDAAGRPVLVCRQKRIPFSKAAPVYVVPATPEAMEALVEKVAQALFAHTYMDGRLLVNLSKTFPGTVKSYRDQARAALSAVFGKGGKP